MLSELLSSVSCTMSLQSCNCLGTRNSSSSGSNYVRIGYDPIGYVNEFVVARLKIPSWRALWRKIKREKRRFLSCSPAIHVHLSYDPNSYSQNFDDGHSTDPDNVVRSFSARFAVPSRIFVKNQEVG